MNWYVIEGWTDIQLNKKFEIYLAKSFEEASNDYYSLHGCFPQIIIKATIKYFYMIPIEFERWSLDDMMGLKQYLVKE